MNYLFETMAQLPLQGYNICGGRFTSQVIQVVPDEILVITADPPLTSFL